MKKYIIPIMFMVCFILFSSFLTSQTDLNYYKNRYSEMLGANNYGKEFWFSIPPCFEDESTGFVNFIKLFITSPVKTSVTVEVPGKGFYKVSNTIPNDVIEVNLNSGIGTPWLKSGYAATPADAIYEDAGIHVFADQPLVVYCVVRYHYTSDGFLVYPLSSLGKSYITMLPEVDPLFNGTGYKLPATVTVTAAYDNTKVNFTLGGNVSTITTGGMLPNNSKIWTLNKGDVLSVSTEVGSGDLSGSKIESDKPVSVVSGNFCANIPAGNQWCDYTVEMEIPDFTWGKDLHVPRIPERKLSSMIKIVAKEANTVIYRNGFNIGTIQQAGGVEGKGFFYMRMTSDMLPNSVVFSGDKPIAVTLFNTGVHEDGYPPPASDPFAMGITPVSQYMKEITFCTPGILGGQGFIKNKLNLVYEVDTATLMMPNHFEYAGPIKGGVASWNRINSRFAGPDDLFTYDVNGKKYAVKTINLPSDGVYRIRANTPFAAYSFGFSEYDSYGYPTSAALSDQEHIDTNEPAPRWTINSGNINDGVVTDMPDDSQIRSNLSMVVFHADSSYNYTFLYDGFVPGETRTTNWRLNVDDPQKDAKAIITFLDRRGNDTTIIIDYNGVVSVNTGNDFGFSAINISPNPVIDNSATISFSLAVESAIEFKLFDNTGKFIRQLAAGFYPDGIHSINLDIQDLPNGYYFVRLIKEKESLEKQLIISR